MPKLILTVGLPRSGKSTWARSSGFPVVNPDSIRLAVHGQAFKAEVEPLIWGLAHTMVDSLFLAGHPVVVLDATNTTKRRRREWVSERYECRYKVFDTPVEVCIERAMAGQAYLIPVIGRMSKQWEPLGPEEKVYTDAGI
jgi:predicted kinase